MTGMTNGFTSQWLTREVRHAREALAALLARRRGPPATLEGLSPRARALLRQILAERENALRLPSLPVAAIDLELRDVIGIQREAGGGAAARYVLVVNGWAVEPLRRHPELLAA